MGVRQQRGRAGALTAAFAAIAVVGCTSDPPPAPPAVSVDEAYAAIVEWEVQRTEPVVDENGDVELPLIYLTSSSGATVDIGVQAAVVETTAETANVRFADDITESIDSDVEGAPVKDGGVMIVVGDFEPDQRSVDVQITRYEMIDDDQMWQLAVQASAEGARVTSSAVVEDPLT